MNANSLEILEQSNLPSEQAGAIWRAMDLEIAGRDERLMLLFRGEMQALEMRMMERFGRLESEMKALEARMVLWMFGMFVTWSGLMYAFLHPRV
jgi:hypothetical protein